MLFMPFGLPILGHTMVILGGSLTKSGKLVAEDLHSALSIAGEHPLAARGQHAGSDCAGPPNTYATVRLPKAILSDVRESGVSVSSACGVPRAAQAEDDVVVEIGAGNFEFAYRAPVLPTAGRLRSN
jgi:hypothetical protein